MNDQHEDIGGTDREFDIVDGKLVNREEESADFEENLTFNE
jgi:hypothetical protein